MLTVLVFQAFVEEQNKLTMPYLEQCAVRAQFHQRLTELYDYPKYSCPYKRGKRYWWKDFSRICDHTVWGTVLSHFLFLFLGISTFTMRDYRTKMCCMFRILWMDRPLCFLTPISSLKMAPWRWRVSQTAERVQFTVRKGCTVLSPSFLSLSLSPSSGPTVRGVWMFCVWPEQQWFRLGDGAFHEGWWPHLTAWHTGEG